MRNAILGFFIGLLIDLICFLYKLMGKGSTQDAEGI